MVVRNDPDARPRVENLGNQIDHGTLGVNPSATSNTAAPATGTGDSLELRSRSVDLNGPGQSRLTLDPMAAPLTRASATAGAEAVAYKDHDPIPGDSDTTYINEPRTWVGKAAKAVGGWFKESFFQTRFWLKAKLGGLPSVNELSDPANDPRFVKTLDVTFDVTPANPDGIDDALWGSTDGDYYWDRTLYGGEYGSGELQIYTRDGNRVVDGVLYQTATKTPVAHADFESGGITTNGRFEQQYGRFDIVCKMPKGGGQWPAFWLLTSMENQPNGHIAEIDVFEHLTNKPNKMMFTNHWGMNYGSDNHEMDGGNVTGFKPQDEYCRYTIEWTPTELVWKVNDVVVARNRSGIPREKMYLLVNNAVGGWGAPVPDNFDQLSEDDRTFKVKSIQVYQWAEPPEEP